MDKDGLYALWRKIMSTFDTELTKAMDIVDNEFKKVKTINVTYKELTQYVETKQLKPGWKYRITDYKTHASGENILTADNVFDIIVTALNECIISENASTVQRDGTSYFEASDLNAWEIKYCLKNDTRRFAWADANGKGVIYYMKDEHNNECGYDFKNILINGNYTFNYYNDINTDGTVSTTKCYNNIIKPYYIDNVQYINNIYFVNNYSTDNCHSNVFNVGCHDIILGGGYYSVTFGNGCSNVKFSTSKNNGTILNYVRNVNVGDECHDFNMWKDVNTNNTKYIQNINVCKYLTGNTELKGNIINRIYTTDICYNSKGLIRQLCLADGNMSNEDITDVLIEGENITFLSNAIVEDDNIIMSGNNLAVDDTDLIIYK